MQGGTPHARGAGNLVCKAHIVRSSRDYCVGGDGMGCIPIPPATTKNAHSPMHPANAGCYLAVSHGWKPVGQPRWTFRRGVPPKGGADSGSVCIPKPPTAPFRARRLRRGKADWTNRGARLPPKGVRARWGAPESTTLVTTNHCTPITPLPQKPLGHMRPGPRAQQFVLDISARRGHKAGATV